jgi:PAS domain S-box-containing protein
MNERLRSPVATWFAGVVVLAVACYVTGRWGRVTILPTGATVSLWTCSGIGLAGLLLLGNRAWPGVWLGSFFVELAVTWDGSSGALGASLVRASVMSSGAALQAVVGAWLLRRIWDKVPSVDELTGFLALIVLGGFASSVLGASVSAVLTAAKFDAGTWLAQWWAELTGVVVFAPLVLVLADVVRRGFQRPSPGRVVEFGLLFIVLPIVVFPLTTDSGTLYGILFVTASILWSTLRFGKVGTALSLLTIALLLASNMQGGDALLGTIRNSESTRAHSAYTILDTAGLVFWSLAAILNEREQAARDLRENEERYRSLVEMAPDLIAILENGRITYCNPGGFALLGAGSPEAVLGRPIDHFVHPDDRAACSASIQTVVETGRPVPSRHFRVIRADGELMDVELRGGPCVYRGGPAVQIAGRNISKRRRAEEALRASEERFRQFGEGMPHIIWMTSSDHENVLYVNQAFERIYGRKREELYASSRIWLDGIHPDDRKRVAEVRTAGPGDGGYCEEFRVVHVDGTVRWIRDRAVPMRNERGEVYMHAGIAEDITPGRRVAEELALQQAELLHVSRLSTVGQMVATLSHEVAQPMSAIAGFAAVCARHLQTPPESWDKLESVRQCVDAIVEENRRCAEILRSLREYSRKSPRHRCGFDLNDVLRESIALTVNELRRHDVRIDCELAPASLLVVADRIQLQQVVVNLLTNARDALLDVEVSRRMITLRSFSDGDLVILEVEDGGIGLPSEETGRIFEPFFTTKDKGMGIGLSICRTILKEHDGEIQAFSNSKGGATFRVVLPTGEWKSDDVAATCLQRG